MAPRPIASRRALGGLFRSLSQDRIGPIGAAGLWWEANSQRRTDRGSSSVDVQGRAGEENKCEQQDVNSFQTLPNPSSHRWERSFGKSATLSRCFTSQGFLPSKGLERTDAPAEVPAIRQPHNPGAFCSFRRQHTDDFLAQRAVAERNRRQSRVNIRSRQRGNHGGVSTDVDFQTEFETSEERIAAVLGRPDLIVTRNLEWANIALGFEQQNRYVIMDPREPQAPAGYIVEDSSILLRQLLRTRRPFTAQVLDGNGVEVCRVRRPAWLINSTIYVEVDGKVVGQAHRRWHLWRRIYDCYLGSKQFAAVENPGFWYWTFVLQDENQGTLAVIDRNWRGFGFEFLTDAGQYVVRFGDSDRYDSPAKLRPRQRVFQEDVLPAVSRSQTVDGGTLRNIAATADAEAVDPGFLVARPLSMAERAVTLALAVSLDNDYFSRHSGGFGFIPIPFFGAEEVQDSSVASTDADRPEDIETSDADSGGFFSDVFDGDSTQ